MAEDRQATPGIMNLFGLPIGARAQVSLPSTPKLNPTSTTGPPLVQNSINRPEAIQHQRSHSQSSALIQPANQDGSAQRRNREDTMPPPQLPPFSTHVPVNSANAHISNPIRHSRSITHINMSEDDLRSWAAAAEALLPTLASVDRELSNSSLDDKVSGRRR